MPDKKIRTAIIGMGYLGRHHVEQLLRIPEAELVEVYDIKAEVMAEVQQGYNVSAFETCEEALSAAEAVSVVVPTQQHFEMATRALESGCHVFIEKRICQTLAEADRLLGLAESRGRLIQVGHIERLNPAIGGGWDTKNAKIYRDESRSSQRPLRALRLFPPSP